MISFLFQNLSTNSLIFLMARKWGAIVSIIQDQRWGNNKTKKVGYQINRHTVYLKDPNEKYPRAQTQICV